MLTAAWGSAGLKITSYSNASHRAQRIKYIYIYIHFFWWVLTFLDMSGPRNGQTECQRPVPRSEKSKCKRCCEQRLQKSYRPSPYHGSQHVLVLLLHRKGNESGSGPSSILGDKSCFLIIISNKMQKRTSPSEKKSQNHQYWISCYQMNPILNMDSFEGQKERFSLPLPIKQPKGRQEQS